MAANECNYVPEHLPNRWAFDHFKQCEVYEGSPTVPVLALYRAVILEAFLWGLGTAIGELPPYFVSKAASMAGKKNEELEEMLDEDKLDRPISELSLYDRTKVLVYRLLNNHAFIVVTILASVPNPLFDFAGMICGQFLIPFPVFFGATFIGKAIIKVSL
eukprot:CAMPEP_0202970310 /NCGR_PEP_ID=MMETSP1396-20130829/16276_1 /ASSEMBLY_ACC=CAM_ASM_000872 /TAXON_ID= /ORGANISM="Pseudokeronopsis sp., Strain Brazil" /LENGTH=159 /DNA_ID=CAMNT_0049698721 /DNA_START=44 /DNA_END=523 /DNA_ORIENTATION=+